MTDIIHNPKRLGENLKRLRVSSDRTLQQAADHTGLSKSFLSMLESGARSIQFQDLRRIVQYYGYSLGWFLTQTFERDTSGGEPLLSTTFSRKKPSRSTRQTRQNESFLPIISTDHDGILMMGTRTKGALRLVLQRPLRSMQDVEVLSLVLPKQSQLTEEEMTVETEVRGVVRQGTLLLVIEGDEYIAREGDEFCFDGSMPHVFRNYTSELTAATLIIHPPLL